MRLAYQARQHGIRMDFAAFRVTCAELGLALSAAQLSAFEAFESALYSANETKNLTRIPRDACWLRHFVDSLLMAKFLPTRTSVLDIGTGPGFPAWPLACARPDLAVTALDSNGKMLGFLLTQPLPNLRVLQARAEDKPERDAYDVVTGRALAPLPIQLELSAAQCKVGGIVLPMRTTNDEPFGEAPPGLGLKLARVHRVLLPGTEALRSFPEYRKVSTTPMQYPRPWAELRRG